MPDAGRLQGHYGVSFCPRPTFSLLWSSASVSSACFSDRQPVLARHADTSRRASSHSSSRSGRLGNCYLSKQQDGLRGRQPLSGRRAALEVQAHGADGADSSSGTLASPAPPGRSHAVLRIAGAVGAATAVCKVLGLLREMVIAARFGVGPVVDAYNYASIVPGFFYVLLGGINGPFHTAITASASRRSPEDAGALVESISILTGLLLAAVTIALVLAAAPAIDIVAPGLRSASSAGALTRQLAMVQLRLMAPAVLLSGLMGIMFGASVTAGSYVLPALSPGVSSLVMISVLGAYPHLSRLVEGMHSMRSALPADASMAGAVAIGTASTLGVVCAWIMQVAGQARRGLGKPLALRWPDADSMHSVQEVGRLLVPAIASSGMLQIAVLTDLYFASFIPGAAASLGYANMLAMAPVGIISSAVLVPIVPRFAAAATPEELARVVHKTLVSVAAATLLLIAVMVPLAPPLVRVAFQRQAFDAAATASVATLLVLYIAGATVYLMRDVLVRVFQSRGNGTAPFIVSVAAIACNVVLDWYLALHLGYGAPGLVVATVCVHIFSALSLLLLLKRDLPVFQLSRLLKPLGFLAAVAAASSIATAAVHKHSMRVLASMGAGPAAHLPWLSAPLQQLVAAGIAVVLGTLVFGALGMAGVTEVQRAVQKLGLSKQLGWQHQS